MKHAVCLYIIFWFKGTVYLHGGMKYNGSFKRGKMHGYGKFEWGDGTTYTGYFVKGELHGQGRCFLKWYLRSVE